MSMNFAYKNLFLHGTGGFTFALKDDVLWIFITIKNPLSSARFEPVDLGLNGKHNNH
jgi:hypothetical protein